MPPAAARSSECRLVHIAVRLRDANPFGPTLAPTCSGSVEPARPAVICRPHGAVQGARVKGLLGEVEDFTRSLFVVEAATGYDDRGPEIETCLQPAGVGAEAVGQH